jgi:hypothetical protein
LSSGKKQDPNLADHTAMQGLNPALGVPGMSERHFVRRG